jgi:hypothetical protein
VIGGSAPIGGHVISSTNPTGGASAWKATVLRDVPDEGVNAFCDSFDQLLACLASKLSVVGAVDR